MSILVKGSGGGSKGEDLTVEKNEMGLLIQEIEESLVGKASGANIIPEVILKGYRGYKGKTLIEGILDPDSLKTGVYAWRKFDGVKQITLAQTTSSVNPTILQVNSEKNDLSKVDASWFVGFKGTYTANNTNYPWEILSETEIKINTSTVNYTYNPTTAQLSINMNLSGGRTWSDYEEYDSVDYVVSDNISAYPDAGELNGYWYELVEDSIATATGFECGEFVLSSATNNVTIEHSLSKIPSFVAIIHMNPKGVSTAGYLAYLNGVDVYYNSGIKVQAVSGITKTDKNIKVSVGHNFIAGNTYYYVMKI